MKSVVVPVYNSCKTLETLVCRLEEVLGGISCCFELVLVDDGSIDGSFEEIKRLVVDHPAVRGYRLSRNFGHQAALTIGLRKSRGDMIAIIDDDLQDPPELLPTFFAELSKDTDVVYGIRRKRKESWVKRFLFSTFYKLLNRISQIDIPRDTGDFCAMTKQVRDEIIQMYDANPFLRGARAWVGFRQKGVEYERSAREIGDSGYTMLEYIRLAVTGIVMFSILPLRIASFIGLFATSLSLLYSIFLLAYWLVKGINVPGFISTILLISFFGGIQLVSIGLIGEYVGRLLGNSRRWPVAIVRETTMEPKE